MSQSITIDRIHSLLRSNQTAQAESLCIQALETNPAMLEILRLLAHIRLGAGNLTGAEEALARACTLAPDDTALWIQRVRNLQNADRLPLALNCCRHILDREPENAQVYMEMGNVLRRLGHYDVAESSYRQAIRRDPSLFGAWNNLGNILRLKGMIAEASSCYRKALELRPDKIALGSNLGLALCEQGKLEEAEATYRQVIDSDPACFEALSSLMMVLCYRPDIDTPRLFAEHRACARRYESLPDSAPRQIAAAVHPGRTGDIVRIGYVSPDFRMHSVAFFTESLFRYHDRRRFSVIGYSNVTVPDAVTGRFRQLSDAWRDIAGITDRQLATKIDEDGIDILVDLAGHTGGNRLGAFAYRPAPVQVTYCGYPGSTGLTTIDARLTDELADPSGQECYHSERLMRLDECFLCYTPPVDAPEIAPLPMLHAPGPVLGSFNALPKINEHVMSLWVQLLKALPDARLVLKNRSFGDPALRSAWIERFAREGIERDRITILGHTATLHEHLECYGGIDIALDTFPYCGTTTTCEALWMGVPVVTLVGTRHAARVGLSLLNAVGLKECITQTESEYMEAVCRLAADEGRLASLREGMRRRMLDSPLCEPHRFVSNVESLYEMLLQREIPHTNANEKQ